MKKRFWTRLIAAVLTTAMAFSILAVPASAASAGNSWAIGVVTDESEVWYTEAAIRHMLQEDSGKVPTDDEVRVMKEVMVSQAGMEEYKGSFPEGAYMGLALAGSTPYWYGIQAIDKTVDQIAAIDDNGVIAYKDGTSIAPIGNATPVDPDPTPGETETLIAIGEQDEDLDAYWWDIGPVSTVRETFVQARKTLENGEDISEGLQEMGINVEVFISKTSTEIEQMSDDELIDFTVELGLAAAKAPAEAACGVSATADSKVYWYTNKQINDVIDAAEGNAENVKWENGVFTVGEEKFNPMNPDVSEPSTSSSSSAGGSAVAIVAAAGAAAAAATGVYFYTHPEKWQEIKEYFAELSANVQAKFQDFTDGVKGALGIPTEEAETAETVENAAVPQDAAA